MRIKKSKNSIYPISILAVIRHPVGGIRTYLKYVYGGLDPTQYRFTVLTTQELEADLIRSDLSKFQIRLLQVSNTLPELFLVFNVFLLSCSNNYSLIHSHGFTAGMLSAAGNFATRLPHIMTSHDVLRPDQFLRFKTVKRILIWFLLKQINCIQSVSYDAQNNLLAFIPLLRHSLSKLSVIQNGIRIKRSALQENDFSREKYRKQLGVQSTEIMFGFLGRFMEQKGFHLVISAVEKLANDSKLNHNFKVLAVNDGAYIREYKTQINKKLLNQYFMFKKFVPDVMPILLSIDALLMPSLWEAFGLLACEAMIVGCPLIASDCIGLREVVHNTPAMIIKSGDSNSLATKMRQFIQNPSKERMLASNFIVKARERFDAKHTSNKLNTLFINSLQGLPRN